MKIILKVDFNNTQFNGFTIENPGHLPEHGEIFNCKWEDFITNKSMLQLLKKTEADDCFIVERFLSKYSKDESTCFITLHLTESFEKNFKSNRRKDWQ